MWWFPIFTESNLIQSVLGNERVTVTVTSIKKWGSDVCYIIWHWTSVTLLNDQSPFQIQILRYGHLLRSLPLSDFLAHSGFWNLFFCLIIHQISNTNIDIILVCLQFSVKSIFHFCGKTVAVHLSVHDWNFNSLSVQLAVCQCVWDQDLNVYTKATHSMLHSSLS